MAPHQRPGSALAEACVRACAGLTRRTRTNARSSEWSGAAALCELKSVRRLTRASHRGLRDARDETLAELNRCKAELESLRRSHSELQERCAPNVSSYCCPRASCRSDGAFRSARSYRATQSRCEVSVQEMRSQLKVQPPLRLTHSAALTPHSDQIKSFELERLRLSFEGNGLRRASAPRVAPHVPPRRVYGELPQAEAGAGGGGQEDDRARERPAASWRWPSRAARRCSRRNTTASSSSLPRASLGWKRRCGRLKSERSPQP